MEARAGICGPHPCAWLCMHRYYLICYDQLMNGGVKLSTLSQYCPNMQDMCKCRGFHRQDELPSVTCVLYITLPGAGLCYHFQTFTMPSRLQDTSMRSVTCRTVPHRSSITNTPQFTKSTRFATTTLPSSTSSTSQRSQATCMNLWHHGAAALWSYGANEIHLCRSQVQHGVAVRQRRLPPPG